MKSKFVQLSGYSRALLTASAVMIGLSGCVVHVGNGYHSDDFHERARHESNQTLSLSSQSISRLHIESGAGSVEVRGIADSNQIVVDGHIYSRKEDGYDMVFTLERSGNQAVLVGKRRNSRWGNTNSRVDMVVSVPAHLLVEIDDGSGPIAISDIANDVVIDDGSGSIDVEAIGGDLTIKDGSGRIEVSHVDGAVTIDDNSGALSVVRVSGKVDIDDGSGAINVQDVTNEVRINDGSGGISVARVESLNIVEAGSGGVNIEDVENDYSSQY